MLNLVNRMVDYAISVRKRPDELQNHIRVSNENETYLW